MIEPAYPSGVDAPRCRGASSMALILAGGNYMKSDNFTFEAISGAVASD
jgi:hypothetical protein